MSSILKALKKLEQEGFEKQSGKVWPDSFQSLKEKGKRIHFKKKAMLFLFLLLILVVFSGGLILYSFRNSARSTQTPIEVTQHRVTLTPTPKKEEKIDQTPVADSGKQFRTDAMRSNIVKIPAMEIKPLITEQGLLLKTPPKTIDPETLISDEAKTMATVEERDDKTRIPELKDDPRIDLQAIAWAADEKKSFIVINNRIIRQGQTFDGIAVTRINKDEVCFREGHNEWCEKFRIK